MFKFTAGDWFKITGRGWVAAIKEPLPQGVYDPDQLQGRQVLIDGVEYKVRGVESYAIPRSIERPYRGAFSLCVGPERVSSRTVIEGDVEEIDEPMRHAFDALIDKRVRVIIEVVE